MSKKVTAQIKKENDKIFLKCEAFGIEEYCTDENQAQQIIQSKAQENVEIEWVKEYIEK